jgi:hypothetical protein
MTLRFISVFDLFLKSTSRITVGIMFVVVFLFLLLLIILYTSL